MWYYITKIAVSATLIVAISEIAKRSSVMGAILASVPLVSIISMIWLYHESGDTAKVIALASNIVWLVLPSLVLFIALPILLKNEIGFYFSLGISIVLTVIAYVLMLSCLHLIRG
jgi:cobalamin synthase